MYSRYGRDKPAYINVVREPLDRRVSLYYYKRNEDIDPNLTQAELNMVILGMWHRPRSLRSREDIFLVLPYNIDIGAYDHDLDVDIGP